MNDSDLIKNGGKSRMSTLLKIGGTLFHKTNRTKCKIFRLDEENIWLKLEEPINEKSELVLPVKHIGEWLFFNQNDIDLSLDEISKIDVYVKYGNQKIVSYLARSDLQEQWTKKNSKYVETQPSKFIVYKNSFLTKNVIAYFNGHILVLKTIVIRIFLTL